MKVRRIVITGVTRALGRSLVDGLVEVGQCVAGCGRSVEAIEALRERRLGNSRVGWRLWR
jgi:short-subunit dehydrogenase